MKHAIALSPLLLALLALSASAQQVADKDFRPSVGAPMFAEDTGPVVCLDEAHHNFHTLDGRFLAFGRLAAREVAREALLRDLHRQQPHGATARCPCPRASASGAGTKAPDPA